MGMWYDMTRYGMVWYAHVYNYIQLYIYIWMMDGLVVFRSFQWIWNRLFPKDPPMFRKDPSVDVTSGWALHPFHFGCRFQAANMNSYSKLRRLEAMTFPRHMTEFLFLMVFNSFDGIFLGPSTFRCPLFPDWWLEQHQSGDTWRYM